MNTDYNVRAPFFELVAKVTDTVFLKYLACLGPDLVHKPIEVLHPILLVSEEPVVDRDKFVCQVMRFFSGPDHSHGDRFTVPKPLQSDRNRVRGTAMTTASVG